MKHHLPSDSNNLKQMELLPTTKSPGPISAPLEAILKRPSFLRACMLVAELSGLEDKQLCGELDIDNSHFTKMKSGASNFPTDERLLNFLNYFDTDIPLIWLAEKRGYDWRTIRKYRSTLEQRLEESEKSNAFKDEVIAILLGQRK